MSVSSVVDSAIQNASREIQNARIRDGHSQKDFISYRLDFFEQMIDSYCNGQTDSIVGNNFINLGYDLFKNKASQENKEKYSNLFLKYFTLLNKNKYPGLKTILENTYFYRVFEKVLITLKNSNFTGEQIEFFEFYIKNSTNPSGYYRLLKSMGSEATRLYQYSVDSSSQLRLEDISIVFQEVIKKFGEPITEEERQMLNTIKQTTIEKLFKDQSHIPQKLIGLICDYQPDCIPIFYEIFVNFLGDCYDSTNSHLPSVEFIIEKAEERNIYLNFDTLRKKIFLQEGSVIDCKQYASSWRLITFLLKISNDENISTVCELIVRHVQSVYKAKADQYFFIEPNSTIFPSIKHLKSGRWNVISAFLTAIFTNVKNPEFRNENNIFPLLDEIVEFTFENVEGFDREKLTAIIQVILSQYSQQDLQNKLANPNRDTYRREKDNEIFLNLIEKLLFLSNGAHEKLEYVFLLLEKYLHANKEGLKMLAKWRMRKNTQYSKLDNGRYYILEYMSEHYDFSDKMMKLLKGILGEETNYYASSAIDTIRSRLEKDTQTPKK